MYFLFLIFLSFFRFDEFSKNEYSYSKDKVSLIFSCSDKEKLSSLIKGVTSSKQKRNVQEVELVDYASEFILRMEIFPGFKNVVINCDERDQISWINETWFFFFSKYRYISTKGIKKLELKRYSSEILSKLYLCEETKELLIYCYDEKNVDWLDLGIKQKKIIMTNFKLFDNASKIIQIIKAIEIENLTIVGSDENSVMWLDKKECYNMIRLENTIKVYLVDYATEFLTRIVLDKRTKFLVVSVSKKNCFEWIKVFEENDFIKQIKSEKLNKKIEFSFIHKNNKCSKNFHLKKPFAHNNEEEIKRQQTKLLSKRQLRNLTKKQFSFLIENNFFFLRIKQFSFFEPDQFSWITPNQINFFDENILNSLNREQIQSISCEAVSSIPLNVFSKLNKKVLSYLTTNQTEYLMTVKKNYLEKNKRKFWSFKNLLVGSAVTVCFKMIYGIKNYITNFPSRIIRGN